MHSSSDRLPTHYEPHHHFHIYHYYIQDQDYINYIVYFSFLLLHHLLVDT